jgi:hypothetical protein
MSGTLNLNNTERIICDSIFLIRGDDITNIYDLFLSKRDASDIEGLPPETLNTLQEIANSIGNDEIVLILLQHKLLKKEIYQIVTVKHILII